jgi:hypothetical protein
VETPCNESCLTEIDSIYKKYDLELPSFKTWKPSDLNKGPSDRGVLQKHPTEFDLSPDGPAKVKYDAYGNKTLVPLEEVRILIRNILEENFLVNPIKFRKAG